MVYTDKQLYWVKNYPEQDAAEKKLVKVVVFNYDVGLHYSNFESK